MKAVKPLSHMNVTVDIPGSKSISHRALITAGLAEGKSGKLLIKTNRRNGAFSAIAGVFKGHPDNPMTWEDLKAKMIGCASSSVRAISETKLGTLCEMVKKLEEVKNCVDIIQFMIA